MNGFIKLINSGYDFIVKGGPVMIPIFGLSIIGLAIAIERFRLIRKRKGNLKELLTVLKTKLEAGKRDEAIEYCKSQKTSIAKVAAALIESSGINSSRERLENAADEAIITEMPQLERHIGMLGIIASVEPLLGLLGTVTGMIRAFFVISNINLSDPAQLASGIAEALYTTAAGLIVGIPAIAAYNYLLLKIESINWEMEQVSSKLINFLSGDSNAQAQNDKTKRNA